MVSFVFLVLSNAYNVMDLTYHNVLDVFLIISLNNQHAINVQKRLLEKMGNVFYAMMDAKDVNRIYVFNVRGGS